MFLPGRSINSLEQRIARRSLVVKQAAGEYGCHSSLSEEVSTDTVGGGERET